MTNSFQKPLKGNVGVVFGSFAPLHQGHLDLILRAKKENNGGALVIVCGYDRDKGEPLLPHETRYRCVREFFRDDDLVAVYKINENEIGIENYPYGWDGWLEEFERIYEEAVEPCPVDGSGLADSAERNLPKRIWYVGDEDYRRDLLERGEDAVLVDRLSENPISGTMIRQNPLEHWSKIAGPFRRHFSVNILVTGTASEGKSTLVADLGRYFNAPHSHEWARDYMEQRRISEWEFGCADFLALLEGQYRHNRERIDSPGNQGVFFADTDSLVTNMYAQYFAKDPSCALTEREYEETIKPTAYFYARQSRWDKIFCIVPHGTFVDDHSRCMAHSGMEERLEMFDILRQSLADVGDWDKVVVLDGDYYENFTAIVKYVRTLTETSRR